MQVKAKGKTLLKVTGIIYIVWGAILFIVTVLGGVGIAAMMNLDPAAVQEIDAQYAAQGLAMTVADATSTVVVMGLVISAILAVVYLVTGIIGVKNSNKPQKAKSCITMAIIILVLVLANAVYSLSQGAFVVWSVALSCVLPILYLYGGILNKQSAETTMTEE